MVLLAAHRGSVYGSWLTLLLQIITGSCTDGPLLYVRPAVLVILHLDAALKRDVQGRVRMMYNHNNWRG